MKLNKKTVKVYEHCEVCKIDLHQGYEYYEIKTAYIDKAGRPQTRAAIICGPCTEDLYPNQINRVPKPLFGQEDLFGES